MRELIDHWLRLPSVDPATLDRLSVSYYAAQIIGGVRQGKHGLLLPVYIDPPSIYRTVKKPALIDLVGFDPDQPGHFRSLCGNGVMLGEAAFREAIYDRLPLPVFREPLRWLQNAGAGIVPLDHHHFARTVIGRPFLELVGEDLECGEELLGLLKRVPRCDLPEVRVAL